MSLLDIAQARKGKARDGVGKAKAGVSQAGTRVEYGTATSASADGYVEIIMDNGGSAFTVPCDSPIAAGDRVSYISHAGQGKAVSLVSLTALAEQADTVASEAEAVANATNQHFWTDTDGVHVTEVTQDGWSDSSSTDYHSGANILINSLGILLRKALMNLVSITESAIAFYDGLGNAASNITAQFGKDGAQIGSSTSANLSIASTGIIFKDKNSASIAEMMNSGVTYAERATTSENAASGSSSTKTITMGVRFTSGDTLTVWFYGNPWGMSDAITMTAGTAYTTAVDIYAYPGGTRTKVGMLTKNANDQFLVGYNVGLQGSIYVEYTTSAYDAPFFTFGTRGSTTRGAFSATIGRSLRASNACVTALGKYNANMDRPLVIGTGSSDTDRESGFSVTWSGSPICKSPNIDIDGSTLPGTQTLGNARLYFQDADNTTIAQVSSVRNTDGHYGMVLGPAGNYLYLRSDGTAANADVGFSSRTPWQTALRIGAATLRYTTVLTTPTSTTIVQFPSGGFITSNSNLLSYTDPDDTDETYPYGIKCAVAGTVVVSAGYYVSSIASGTGGAAIIPYRSASSLGEFVAPYDNTMHMAEALFPPRVISVSAGDVITLRIRTTAAGTIAAHKCWLTVQYVG